MKLPEFGVNRPVMTLMIFFAILILGGVALYHLPIDLMPKIDIPTLSVITDYRGASAEDVEEKITKILESGLSSVQNIKDVSSVSAEGVSAISLRFDWGTDLDEAANDIRQGLSMAKMMLPEDADDPILIKFDLSMMPILFYGITAEESYEDLHKIIDEKFCTPLKRIPGVALTVIMGGLEREIQVNVDRQRLEAYNLSMNMVTQALWAENLTQPAGNLKVGQTDYIVRVPGEFSNVNEIRDVILAQIEGKPVYLKDIARVEDSFKDKESRVRIDRKPGIMVMVRKQSGANTVTVAERVRKALPGIVRKLPSDVKVHTIMDSSDFIKQSVKNLSITLFWALIFVLLIVFIFLREFRGSLIVAITIPFSLIISFIFLFIAGYTINMMTLSALAIAIGMVIDNGIVVFENTFRHRADEGDTRREAAIFGSSEVGMAVTASTLTTVSIFLPIVFVKGLTGVMFKELALVIIIVLFASLFSSLTLTPMLSSRFMLLPSEHKKRTRLPKKLYDLIGVWFASLSGAYRSLLGWALNHRLAVICIGGVVFIGSLFMFTVVGTEFMPKMDQGEYYGTIELPIGTRLEVTDKVMERIEDIFEKNVPERKYLWAQCGKSDFPMAEVMGQHSDVNIIMAGGSLVPKNERSRSDEEISNALRDEVARIPGIKSMDFTIQRGFESMSGEKPVSLEIYGYDITSTDALARRIKIMMESIPGLADIVISRKPGKPELWVEVDRRKASTLGLNMQNIANTINTSFSGTIATKYREGGDEYDTFVRLQGIDRQSIEDLKNVVITSPLGIQVPLRNFARVVEHRGPLTIERKNQERMVTVGAGLYGRPLGDVIKDIRNGLAGMDIPDEIDVKIAGTAEDQAESFQVLFLALILGVVLVYMVMASQFESLFDPFIVMFSVPFAIVGVVWALFITGRTLNIVSYVGMIMLVGIVVNSAIVLVDYINIMRARGLSIRDAILISGPRRLRPVLMTTFTTIFALLPLALRKGEGSEMWSPLAISVIGGLLVSTIITLIFVPTLYSIFEEKLKGRRTFGRVGGRGR